ncbi:FAM92 protein-domain-containing protein [Cladochytrium replicatum]|nr:FAM92 protein-domain-containing protein [Cladochytrium replicatum]
MVNTDDQNLFLQKSVSRTDRSIAALRSTIQGYVRNNDRIRKKNYKLSMIMKQFGDREATGLRMMLNTISEKITEREKQREKMEYRITTMSQEPLKLYGMICGKIQNEIKAREISLDKEKKKKFQLDTLRSKGTANTTKINQSHLELEGATQEVRTATKALVESVQRFEARKRHDLKASLTELIWSEMAFCAKSLEILTSMYQTLSTIDVEGDLQEIEDRINLAASPPPSPTYMSPLRRTRSESRPSKAYTDDYGMTPLAKSAPTSPTKA